MNTFQTHFFLTKTPIILNEFNFIMSISINQSLKVFRNSFHSFYILGVQKSKNQRFL